MKAHLNWRSELACFRSAVGFLTPLGGGDAAPTPRSMTYFPIVGAALGTGLGLFGALCRRSLGPLPTAAVLVAADAALTGALHLDGLADSADGLLAHQPAKARLDIMAAPDLGTFGSVALGLNLVLRTSALSSQTTAVGVLAPLYASSRALMVLGSRALPYARSDGLASAFVPARSDADDATGPTGPTGRPAAPVVAAVAAVGASALVLSAGHGPRGLLVLGAGLGAGAAVLALGQRRLGGFTGDVLGAAGVTCETVGLLVAVAMPGRHGAGGDR